MAVIVTRAGKGSPLTNAEVDANFVNLNTELGTKLDLTAVRASLSASGSLSYNASTGTFSYTQPSAISAFTNDAGYITTAGARTAISVSGSLSYNSTTGVISYTQPTNVSTFTNDAGYATTTFVNTRAATAEANALAFAIALG